MRPLHDLGRVLGALLLPAGFVALYGQGVACGPSCTGIDRAFAGGERWTEGSTLVYETSPFDGPFLPFEGAANYHLRHDLGVVPTDVEIYLAFSDRPESTGNGGFAQSAGNQAVVLSVDAHEVVIKNDTCAAYFFRVVLRGRATADAGTDVTADAPAD